MKIVISKGNHIMYELLGCHNTNEHRVELLQER